MKNPFSGIKSLVALCIILLVAACEKEQIEIEPIAAIEEPTVTENAIVLGEQLENPYSVENMQKALNS